jgi:hypothetical protein
MDFLHATVFCFPTSDTDKTLKVGKSGPSLFSVHIMVHVASVNH